MTDTMPAELAENLIDFCENRARVYALLSRCYEREVDAAFAGAFAEGAALESDDASLSEGFARLQADLAGCAGDEGALEMLAVVFDRAFFGMGPRTAQKAFPYESVYTSPEHLLMQDARDEVLAAYRAARVVLVDEACEPEDHLAFELEFMQLLGERAAEALEAGDEDGCADLLATRRSFIDEHLLNWIPMFVADVHRVARTDFYRAVADIAWGVVEADRELLDDVLDGAA